MQTAAIITVALPRHTPHSNAAPYEGRSASRGKATRKGPPLNATCGHAEEKEVWKS